MAEKTGKKQFEIMCCVCCKRFTSNRADRLCCSKECAVIRSRETSYAYFQSHRDKFKRKGISERRLDLEKDKREGQQGYIMSEKDEKKKAARKKITPMDQWAEAKRNGCTLSYGQWQAQRYIEEMRRGES